MMSAEENERAWRGLREKLAAADPHSITEVTAEEMDLMRRYPLYRLDGLTGQATMQAQPLDDLLMKQLQEANAALAAALAENEAHRTTNKMHRDRIAELEAAVHEAGLRFEGDPAAVDEDGRVMPAQALRHTWADKRMIP